MCAALLMCVSRKEGQMWHLQMKVRRGKEEGREENGDKTKGRETEQGGGWMESERVEKNESNEEEKKEMTEREK